MNLFRSARRASVSFLVSNPVTTHIFVRLALDERILPNIFNDPNLTWRLGQHADLREHFRALLRDESVLMSLIEDPVLLEKTLLSEFARERIEKSESIQHHLLDTPGLLSRVIEAGIAGSHLTENSSFCRNILRLPNIKNAIVDDPELIDFIIGNDAIRCKIVSDAEMAKSIMLSPEAMAQLTTDPAFQQRLLNDERIIAAILEDGERLAELLNKTPMQWVATLQSFIGRLLDEPAVMDQLCAEQRLGCLIQDERVVEFLKRQPAIARALAGANETIATIANNEKLLDKIMDQEQAFAYILERVLGRDSTFNHILDQRGMFGRLLTPDRAIEMIAADDILLSRLHKHGRILEYMLSNHELLGRVLNSDQAFNQIFSDVELTARILKSSSAINYIASSEPYLNRLLELPKFTENLLANEAFFATLIKNKNTLDLILADEDLLTSILSDSRSLKFILEHEEPRKQLFAHDAAFQTILNNKPLLERVANHGNTLEILLADAKLLEKLLSHKNAVSLILNEEKILSRIVSNGHALEYILFNQTLLYKILGHQNSIDKIRSDHGLLHKLIFNGMTLEWMVQQGDIKGWLIQQEPIIAEILKNKNLLERIFADPKMLTHQISSGLIPRLVSLFRDPETGKALKSFGDQLMEQEPVLQGVIENPKVIKRVVERVNTFKPEMRQHLEAMTEFDRQWEMLKPILNLDEIKELDQKINLARLGSKIVEDVPNKLMEIFCDGNIAHLAHGDIEFPDRFSFWTVVNEILLREEYFFETDAEQPRILDCGTNFGMAIYYFKSRYPNARITGFEPMPAMHELAKANIKRLKYKNVMLHPFALAAKECTQTFNLSKTFPLAGSLTSRRKEFGDEIEPVEVECKPMSLYLRQPVHFLKMDIEGSELEVLSATRDQLHRVQHLFVEYHHGAGADPGGLQKILEILDAKGFDHNIGKSYHYGRTMQKRMMEYTGQPYSLNIWGRNRNWPPD